ncbi:hypothetical protein [Dialister hominis]|uniref:hypothetical protein n=1 Tax=Dialister hominis TaxID=2582419 RepID=UPI003FEFAF38
MEIKNTVKTKLVKVKDKAVAFAVKAAPYVVIGGVFGLITCTTAKATYAEGYSKGFFEGNMLGKKAVIEVISDLAKSVETK